MDEYDALGEEQFLRKYGFGPAKWCYVLRNGKRYPSKAIFGVATGKENPERGPLTSRDFSGGETTVVRALRELGFEVETSGAPATTIDKHATQTSFGTSSFHT